MFPPLASAFGKQSFWWSSPVYDEEERLIERRRLWTHDFATCVLTLWDLRRKLRLRGAEVEDGVECAIFPMPEDVADEAWFLGENPSIPTERLADRRQRVRDDIDDRFPGLLGRDEAGGGTYAEVVAVDAGSLVEDRVQMDKDFARETVVVGGIKFEPSGKSNQYDVVREAVVDNLSGFSSSKDRESIERLADAAMVASWRTKVGAEAWEHALRLKPSDDRDRDYALVSRPTEPMTSVATYPRRVVVTAHSHLCEVKSVEEDEFYEDATDTDDDDASCGGGEHWAPDGDGSRRATSSSYFPSSSSSYAKSFWLRKKSKGRRRRRSSSSSTSSQQRQSNVLRCGDERAFIAVTTRTTAIALPQKGGLRVTKCLLAVVLVAPAEHQTRHSRQEEEEEEEENAVEPTKKASSPQPSSSYSSYLPQFF